MIHFQYCFSFPKDSILKAFVLLENLQMSESEVPVMEEADKVSVGSDPPAGLSKYVIDVEDVGPVSVFVEGDLEKLRVSSNIFMTVHTAGTTFQQWVDFNMQEDMRAVRQRFAQFKKCRQGETFLCFKICLQVSFPAHLSTRPAARCS